MQSACLIQVVMFKDKRFEKVSTKQTFLWWIAVNRGLSGNVWTVGRSEIQLRNYFTKYFQNIAMLWLTKKEWLIDLVWHRKTTWNAFVETKQYKHTLLLSITQKPV